MQSSTEQSHESHSNVIPFHQQVQDSEITETVQPKAALDRLDRESFVSWLFLIGSLLFTVDSALENVRGVSVSSLLHLSASILFTVGSVLFIPSNAWSAWLSAWLSIVKQPSRPR